MEEKLSRNYVVSGISQEFTKENSSERAEIRKYFHNCTSISLLIHYRKKKSIFGGSFKSVKSTASVWTGETQKRSKLDKIEEYGKDMLSSAKDAMPWTKH